MPWYSFQTKPYLRFEDIYNSASDCRESEDPETCEHFADALLNCKRIEPKPDVARKILRHLCFSLGRSSSCVLLGDSSLDSPSDFEPNGMKALESYKQACYEGNPVGCRKAAQMLNRFGLIGEGDQHLVMGYQIGMNAIENELAQTRSVDQTKQQEPVEENETPVKKKYQRRMLDRLAELHSEVGHCLTLLQKSESDSWNSIDLDQTSALKRGAYRFTDTFKTVTDGSTSSELVLGQEHSLPTTETTLSRDSLQSDADNHYDKSVEIYKEKCRATKHDNEEDLSCYYLGKLFFDRYVISNQISHLRESVLAWDHGCDNLQSSCCEKLDQTYRTANELGDLPEEIKLFNQQQRKYYAFRSCELKVENCVSYGKVLFGEQREEEAMRLMQLACKRGNCYEACEVLRRKENNDLQQKGFTSWLWAKETNESEEK